MAGILDPGFDGPDIFGAGSSQQASAQGQQQKPGGLLGLLMGLSALGGKNPLNLPNAGAGNGYQLAQFKTAPQMPAMPNQYTPPQFAPPIQPRVPTFDAVAKIRAQLGLPPLAQPTSSSATAPTAPLVNPSLLALYG
jgi:hypothetical protein